MVNMAGTYKKTFLDQVIARVDFASDLPIKESLPDTVARESVKRFPISEPKKAILAKVRFKGADISAQKIETRTEWNFHGKERGKSLCITSSWMWVAYKKYQSFRILRKN